MMKTTYLAENLCLLGTSLVILLVVALIWADLLQKN